MGSRLVRHFCFLVKKVRLESGVVGRVKEITQ